MEKEYQIKLTERDTNLCLSALNEIPRINIRLQQAFKNYDKRNKKEISNVEKS